RVCVVLCVDNPLEVGAAARDSNGTVQRLDIFSDDSLIASTKASELTATLTALAPGPHILMARAVDSQGTEIKSEPVKILVWDAEKVASGGAADMAEVK